MFIILNIFGLIVFRVVIYYGLMKLTVKMILYVMQGRDLFKMLKVARMQMVILDSVILTECNLCNKSVHVVKYTFN